MGRIARKVGLLAPELFDIANTYDAMAGSSARGLFIGSLVRWRTGRRQHGYGTPCLKTAEVPECVPCFRLLGYTRPIWHASGTSKMTRGCLPRIRQEQTFLSALVRAPCSASLPPSAV